MSMGKWTVHLVRKDGRQSRAINPARNGTILIVTGAAFFLVASGAAIGLYWGSRVEGNTVLELRGRVTDLQGELLQVTELASRLRDAEEQYSRLQAAVTDGKPGGDVLPTVRLDERAELGTRSEGETTALAWPLAQRGFITRTFGSRAEASREGHTGVDIAVPAGSYVRAITAGRVEEVGDNEIYGKFVRIAHPSGLSSLYGHNSWLFVSPGGTVERWQVIALAGNTGRSTAPHLHLELEQGGSLLDPMDYVSQRVNTGPNIDPR
jgi:murein DD-endopeptidase MepM/ murein hydrolase activator NlpD